MSLIVGPHHPFASTDEAIDPIVLEEEILIVREPGSGSREMVSQALSANGVEPAVLVRMDHRTEGLVFRKEVIPSLPAIRCQGDLG
jgi:molybdate-binding protein